jgi:sensor c-di-GMP phosphodiesterase-like protein
MREDVSPPSRPYTPAHQEPEGSPGTRSRSRVLALLGVAVLIVLLVVTTGLALSTRRHLDQTKTELRNVQADDETRTNGLRAALEAANRAATDAQAAAARAQTAADNAQKAANRAYLQALNSKFLTCLSLPDTSNVKADACSLPPAGYVLGGDVPTSP